jgi:hypothetical protein
LPVPRFPTFLPTPMLVLEFVLGELFQDDWLREVSSSPTSDALRRWRAVHRDWMRRLLDSQRQAIEEGDPSVLMALKHLRPDPDMLVRS